MSAGVMTGRTRTGQTGSSFASSPSSAVEADLRENEDARGTAGVEKSDRDRRKESVEVEMDLEQAEEDIRGREDDEK